MPAWIPTHPTATRFQVVMTHCPAFDTLLVSLPVDHFRNETRFRFHALVMMAAERPFKAFVFHDQTSIKTRPRLHEEKGPSGGRKTLTQKVASGKCPSGRIRSRRKREVPPDLPPPVAF